MPLVGIIKQGQGRKRHNKHRNSKTTDTQEKICEG